MPTEGFIKAIHHCGLVVRDLDRSIYFYHDVLGLPFANEPTQWLSGPQLEAGVGVPGATLRQVALWAGEHSLMELIEYGNRPASSTSPVPNNYLGAAHVCFLVEDVRARKAELEAKGVQFYSDVNVVDDGPLAGWRWCTSAIPTASPSSSSRSPTTSRRSAKPPRPKYLRERPSLESIEARLV